MGSHRLLTTIGATALGLGVIVGGGAGLPSALAQEAATPPAQTQPAVDPDAERAEAYAGFVAALAGELGDDEAAVDAAIRTALKQQVDARLAAGDIDEEQAAAMKAVIDVSDAPLFGGFGGRGGMHGFGGHDDFDGRGRGGRGDDRDWQFPGSAPASDQSTTGDVAPAADAAIG